MTESEERGQATYELFLSPDLPLLRISSSYFGLTITKTRDTNAPSGLEMGSTQVYQDPTYMKEVWALFAVGVLVIFARCLVRLRTVGIRQFQGDDYMSIIVIVCYTMVALVVTVAYYSGSNVDFTEEQIRNLTDDQIGRVEFGSRMQLFGWYVYVSLIWSLKASMLFFFNRITLGLSQQLAVKLLGIACVVTYLAMLLTITFSCYPIQDNWRVRPRLSERCLVKKPNFYVYTVLNIVTDAALLCVPMPLLWELKMPIRKKLTLTLLLSSGAFVITAAIVRVVKSLDSYPSAITLDRWGVRETFAAILAVNAPIFRPLFSRSFYIRTLNLSNPVVPFPSDTPNDSKGVSTGDWSKQTTSITWRLPSTIESVDIRQPSQTIPGRPSLTMPSNDLDTIPDTSSTIDSRDGMTLRDDRFERGDPLYDDLERGLDPDPPPFPRLPPPRIPQPEETDGSEGLEEGAESRPSEARRFSQWARTSLDFREMWSGRLSERMRRSLP